MKFFCEIIFRKYIANISTVRGAISGDSLYPVPISRHAVKIHPAGASEMPIGRVIWGLR